MEPDGADDSSERLLDPERSRVGMCWCGWGYWRSASCSMDTGVGGDGVSSLPLSSGYRCSWCGGGAARPLSWRTIGGCAGARGEREAGEAEAECGESKCVVSRSAWVAVDVREAASGIILADFPGKLGSFIARFRFLVGKGLLMAAGKPVLCRHYFEEADALLSFTGAVLRLRNGICTSATCASGEAR